MKRLILAFILALGVLYGTSFNALSQNAVITQPKGVNKVDGSGSVAVTNTFQSVFAASTTTTGRLSYERQNASKTAADAINDVNVPDPN